MQPTHKNILLISVIALLAGLAALSLFGDGPANESSPDAPAPAERPSVSQDVNGTPPDPALPAAAPRSDNQAALSAVAGTPGETFEQRLENFARDNPELALQLALSDAEQHRRQELLLAVLRGWGHTDPDAAADWLLDQDYLDRGPAVQALLNGAAHDPAAARRVAESLIRRDLQNAEQHAASMIDAFRQQQSFAPAADFALSHAGHMRGNWVEQTFEDWAAHDPRQAFEHAAAIDEAGHRRRASQATIVRWAQSEPEALARFSVDLPPGQTRADAFATALPAWFARDRESLEQWIADVSPHPDFEEAAYAVATRPDFIREHPRAAADWAGVISNPTQREATREYILEQWRDADPAAAQAYLDAQ